MIAAIVFFLPLLLGLILLMSRSKHSSAVTIYGSLAGLLLTIYAIVNKGNRSLSELDIPWISSLGIHFHLGLDGISGVLVLLSYVLLFLIFVQQRVRNPEPALPGWALLMQAGMNGVFMAKDAVLFYVCWELALIPIYLICLIWSSGNREKITLRFFLFTVIGSLFMLAGFIFIYLKTGEQFSERSFSHEAFLQTGRILSERDQTFVFLLIFLGFAVKIPVMPLHVWQPDTYTHAPYSGTMLLSGLMAKMGTFGYLFWLAPVLPLGYRYWAPLIMFLCVATVLYASCVAIVQKDFKALLAWSSLAHMAMMACGITALKEESMNGAVVMMFSHGLTATGLFMVADIIERHTGTTEISRLGGIRSMNGQFSNLFLIILLGSVALPLTSGFPGEFLILNGMYQFGTGWAVAASLSVILGAVYMLRAYQKIMLGEPSGRGVVFNALLASDKWALSLICAGIIVIGIFPNIILRDVTVQIQELIQLVK